MESARTEYELTVGLEVHAELKTASKMFCGCKNDPFEDEPNVHVCPVCMGHPGTLPVPNKEAIRSVLRVGLAIGGTLADKTEFDRKNYFYPDIPKGYQISQYKHPFVSGGEVAGVAITRIHLEEDTATSSHDVGDYSLVNYNRAGVPLMELVTEPVMHSAEEAGRFAKELQLLLRMLGVSDANMEKGEMRVEANISIAPKGSATLGTKVEVKNLNSFKSVEKSIAYEFERHRAILDEGGTIDQETRGFDESTQKTFSQRKKESSHDYRYFPEPDIPKIMVSEVHGMNRDELAASIPELPGSVRERLVTLGVKGEQVETMLGDMRLLALFDESIVHAGKDSASLAANYITSDLVSLMRQPDAVMPKAHNFAALISMIVASDVSSRGAKDVLAKMVTEDTGPKEIATRENLLQVRDSGAMTALATELLSENPQAVAEFKAGKMNALQFLVGQGMKKSKGTANPGVLREEIEKLLAQ
jgi:aspartyl-tRNA(Asn)/glutamyl-tRNA(Gln) amidotransferase subunit B